MKRVFYNFIEKGWHRWNIYGDYGIVNELRYKNDKYEFGYPKKVRITIEEVKLEGRNKL